MTLIRRLLRWLTGRPAQRREPTNIVRTIYTTRNIRQELLGVLDRSGAYGVTAQTAGALLDIPAGTARNNLLALARLGLAVEAGTRKNALSPKRKRQVPVWVARSFAQEDHAAGA